MDVFSCVFPLLCNISAFQTNVLTETFDFIIVGGGSAGSVLAARLSENPKVKVLLLEAGGCPPFASEVPGLFGLLLTSQEYDWNYKITPQTHAFRAYPNQEAPYPRGKLLGGSSSSNGMIYFRGNKLDYDHWSSLGNKGWSYKEVLPYFKKAEGVTVPSMAADTTYHNTTGPLTVSYAPFQTTSLNTFLQSAQENGYPIRDLNAKWQTGAMRTVFTMRNGSRCSTAKAYLLPAEHRPNLVIACNSRVKRILIDGFQNRASGVTFNHNDTDYFVKASKEVILSAGTIASPQLLLLSGIGPKNQLRKFNIKQRVNLPGVGKNLHDHVGCAALMFTLNCTNCTTNGDQYSTPETLQEWMTMRTGPLTLPLAAEAFAFVNNDSTCITDWPSVQFMYVSFNRQLVLSSVFGASNETILKYLGSLVNANNVVIEPFVMRPKSRGTIKLQSGDYKDAPLINFRYLTDPDDIKILVKGMKTAIAFINSDAFKSFGAQLIPNKFPGCENYQQFSDTYLECLARQFTTIYFHAVGTCKMGVASDTMAVVNSELQVYNVTSLRVVDASIMPQIPTGNTNAPVIMIAEKAADLIKKAHNI